MIKAEDIVRFVYISAKKYVRSINGSLKTGYMQKLVLRGEK